ncbi:hypothetical protein V6Z11_D07G026300 [Gossypium hirsutum]
MRRRHLKEKKRSLRSKRVFRKSSTEPASKTRPDFSKFW